MPISLDDVEKGINALIGNLKCSHSEIEIYQGLPRTSKVVTFDVNAW